MPRRSPKKPVQVDEMFAAYTDTGKLLYITLRPTSSECAEVLHRLNPPVEGFAYGFEVRPVTVTVDVGHQYDLENAIGGDR